MSEQQQPKEQIVNMAQLEEYMLTRASEFQKRGFWDSSFECLYLITVLNRGYYWDTEGRKQIIRSRPAPAAPSQERIGSIRQNIYQEDAYLIECVNAGMGEWEYVIQYCGEYYATAPTENIARDIVERAQWSRHAPAADTPSQFPKVIPESPFDIRPTFDKRTDFLIWLKAHDTALIEQAKREERKKWEQEKAKLISTIDEKIVSVRDGSYQKSIDYIKKVMKDTGGDSGYSTLLLTPIIEHIESLRSPKNSSEFEEARAKPGNPSTPTAQERDTP